MTDGQRRKKQRQRARRRDERVQAQLSAVHMCAYCALQLKLVPDSEVYQRSYGGYVWRCVPCDAFVGCHKGTYLPKGRVSNAALRKLKVEAHALFDAFWRAAIALRGWEKGRARVKAYRWLAEAMGIDVVDCHIGMFDEQQTRRVIEICTAQRTKRQELPKAVVCPSCWDGVHSACTGNGCYCDCQLEDYPQHRTEEVACG